MYRFHATYEQFYSKCANTVTHKSNSKLKFEFGNTNSSKKACAAPAGSISRIQAISLISTAGCAFVGYTDADDDESVRRRFASKRVGLRDQP